ncbi:MAG TPA: HEPN domain-containing protein [Chloroflexota bacterium]|nr:HEPN domain-containing protein [Chloroflexota bacterium]
MPLDPTRVAETRDWFANAALDLRAAEFEFTAVPPLTADIVFHCQQLAEKSLKVFLVWHDQPFRKTHDLVEIGQQCVANDATLESLVRRAAVLTEYAWRYRYPGDPDGPT